MFVAITNTPQRYAWGSRTGIADLLGREPSGERESSSGSEPTTGRPAFWSTTRRVLEAHLPFLLKVLAAESPLSLPAHPSPEQARAGFAREGCRRRAGGCPSRSYRDAFPSRR